MGKSFTRNQTSSGRRFFNRVYQRRRFETERSMGRPNTTWRRLAIEELERQKATIDAAIALLREPSPNGVEPKPAPPRRREAKPQEPGKRVQCLDCEEERWFAGKASLKTHRLKYHPSAKI